jgi:hypothetical protein
VNALNDKRRILKYGVAFILIAVILASVGFVVLNRAADYGEDVFNRNARDFKNINNQFASLMLLFFIGVLAVLPFYKKIGVTQGLLLSFPIGLLLFEFVSIDFLIFGLRYSLLPVLVMCTVVILAIYLLLLKFKQLDLAFSKNQIAKMLFALGVFGLLAYFICYVPIIIISFDSWQYKMLGNIYAREHYMMAYADQVISGHAFVPTLLNSLAYFFNFEYAYGLQNMFTLSGVMLFSYLVYRTSRENDFDKRKSFIFMVASALILSTSFFFVYIGVSLVPNIFAGFFIFFFMVYMKRYLDDRKDQNFILSLIFMVAYCFTRVEGPLVVCFVLGYFVHKKFDIKKFILYTSFVFIYLLSWYLSFFIRFGTALKSPFLTVDKSVLVLCLFIVLIVYAYLKDRYFKKHNTVLLKIYIATVGLFSIALHLLNQSKLINIVTTFKNMFYTGFWTFSWIIVFIFAIMAVVVSKKKAWFLENFILLFAFLFFAIFTFRQSGLNATFSDSGNRMLMHIYPTVIFVLYDNISSFFITDKASLKQR